MSYGIELISKKGTLVVSERFESYRLLPDAPADVNGDLIVSSLVPPLVFNVRNASTTEPWGQTGTTAWVDLTEKVGATSYRISAGAPWTSYVFTVPVNPPSASGTGIVVTGEASSFLLDAMAYPLVVKDAFVMKMAFTASSGLLEKTVPYRAASYCSMTHYQRVSSFLGPMIFVDNGPVYYVLTPQFYATKYDFPSSTSTRFKCTTAGATGIGPSSALETTTWVMAIDADMYPPTNIS